jgi:hypothetical protein
VDPSRLIRASEALNEGAAHAESPCRTGLTAALEVECPGVLGRSEARFHHQAKLVDEAGTDPLGPE